MESVGATGNGNRAKASVSQIPHVRAEKSKTLRTWIFKAVWKCSKFRLLKALPVIPNSTVDSSLSMKVTRLSTGGTKDGLLATQYLSYFLRQISIRPVIEPDKSLG